ncbi:hypothetical protein CP533_3455, partial [Ophiocordyceps camponoti-saundersi (nom. inval.)]
PHLNILICGGGIAGPAAAFWLSRLGHKCTIIERHPNLRADGQQIDLREQGVTVARKMGLLEEIKSKTVDELGTAFVDTRGRCLAFFGRSGNEEQQSFTSEFEIMRGELCNVLHDAAKDRVEWRFGITVDDYHHIDDGRRVNVRFSDGSQAEYDLLIGADGQGSRVRRRMVTEDKYRPLGVFCCYFNTHRREDDGQSIFSFYVAGRRRTVATRWHSPERGQGYFMTMSHPEEFRRVLRQDSASQRALFSRVFAGAGWQADRLITEMNQAEDVYAFEALQVTANKWSKGRVVLLGDAAHAPSFFTGMGTSLALVGAYVLAGELSTHGDDVEAGLDAYESRLRSFVEDSQKLGPGLPGIAFPETWWGVRIFQIILTIMGLIRIDYLLGLLFQALAPKSGQWQVPEYPQLVSEKEASLS